jgi:DNA-binding MarR family transcriptional regulator
MARKAAEKAAGRKVLTTLVDPKDWADVAAAFDRSLRVFSDAVRPVLRGLPASKLSHSNLLLLVVVAADDTVRQADLIRDANLIASNAGYALKALRDAGYVEVEMDPANRRARIVYATEEGRRIAGIIRQRCRVMAEDEGLAEFARAADSLEAGLEAAVHGGVTRSPAKTAEPAVRRSHPASLETAKPRQATPPAISKPAVETVPTLFGPAPGRLPRRRTLG